MAPDAELSLLRIGDIVSLENAGEFAEEWGAHIVNMSAGWPALGFGDGTGPACDVVNKATNQGILWVNAAGNEGKKVYMHLFADRNNNGWHDVDGESEILEISEALEGEEISFTLTWNDWPLTSEDYDLAIVHLPVEGSVEVVETAYTVQLDSRPVEVATHIVRVSGRYGAAILTCPHLCVHIQS